MRAFTVVAVLGLAFMLSGCADQVGVSNNTNSFSYGGQAAGKDKVESYDWKNTMGGARVSWGGQVGDGSITVTISDASGKQVFSRSVSGASQDGFEGSTQNGVPGTWTIRMVFDDYTGQLGLSVNARAGGF